MLLTKHEGGVMSTVEQVGGATCGEKQRNVFSGTWRQNDVLSRAAWRSDILSQTGKWSDEEKPGVVVSNACRESKRSFWPQQEMEQCP